ncbi:MAG: YjfB family protein [Oscillospiraceae bacterium]|nr:YjfB family protein [Oscillospiraceae bacterium]
MDITQSIANTATQLSAIETASAMGTSLLKQAMDVTEGLTDQMLSQMSEAVTFPGEVGFNLDIMA